MKQRRKLETISMYSFWEGMKKTAESLTDLHPNWPKFEYIYSLSVFIFVCGYKVSKFKQRTNDSNIPCSILG